MAKLRDGDLHARSRFIVLFFWGGLPGGVFGTLAEVAHALLRGGSLAWISPLWPSSGGLGP